MASGGVRQDFGTNGELAYGETKKLRWTVNNPAGQPITDMDGWTIRIYLLRNLIGANGIEELEADNLAAFDPEIAAPEVDLPLTDAFWAAYGSNVTRRAYEKWRTDDLFEERMAYGYIVVTP